MRKNPAEWIGLTLEKKIHNKNQDKVQGLVRDKTNDKDNAKNKKTF
jgi:hypothetical protein